MYTSNPRGPPLPTVLGLKALFCDNLGFRDKATNMSLWIKGYQLWLAAPLRTAIATSCLLWLGNSMEYFKEKFVDFARIKDRQAAIQRIENIQRIGWALTPPVEAVVCNSGLLTRQKVIKFSNTFIRDVSHHHIISLSRQVARFNRAGLVHGDLCRSNIGTRGGKVFVFDWEPSLVSE